MDSDTNWYALAARILSDHLHSPDDALCYFHLRSKAKAKAKIQRAPKQYLEETIQGIMSDRLAGAKILELQEKYHIGYTTIRKILIANGITIDDRQNRTNYPTIGDTPEERRRRPVLFTKNSVTNYHKKKGEKVNG